MNYVSKDFYGNLIVYGSRIVGVKYGSVLSLDIFDHTTFDFIKRYDFIEPDFVYISFNEQVIISKKNSFYHLDRVTFDLVEIENKIGKISYVFGKHFFVKLDSLNMMECFTDFNTLEIFKKEKIDDGYFYQFVDSSKLFKYRGNEMFYENIRTGEVIWQHTCIGRIKDLKYIEEKNIVLVSLLLKDKRSSTFCFDSSNGNINWSIDIGDIYSKFSVMNDCIYLYYGGLYAIDLDIGTCRKVELLDGPMQLISIMDNKLYYQSTIRGVRQNVVGVINLNTEKILWEYSLVDINKNEIEIRNWIPLKNGRISITSKNPIRQTILFDPYDPENIPYRTVDNGVINDKNNPYPL